MTRGRRRRGIRPLGLALATVAALVAEARAQPAGDGNPCQVLAVVSGDPADVAAVKDVVRRLADGYAGSDKSVTRFLRDVDASRFLPSVARLERDVARDFELLRNRQLVCRRGTLWVEGDLAVLQSEWEKAGDLARGPGRITRRGAVTIRLSRSGGAWRVTGLLGVPGAPAQTIFGMPE